MKPSVIASPEEGSEQGDDVWYYDLIPQPSPEIHPTDSAHEHENQTSYTLAEEIELDDLGVSFAPPIDPPYEHLAISNQEQDNFTLNEEAELADLGVWFPLSDDVAHPDEEHQQVQNFTDSEDLPMGIGNTQRTIYVETMDNEDDPDNPLP